MSHDLIETNNLRDNFLEYIPFPTPIVGVTRKKTCFPTATSRVIFFDQHKTFCLLCDAFIPSYINILCNLLQQLKTKNITSPFKYQLKEFYIDCHVEPCVVSYTCSLENCFCRWTPPEVVLHPNWLGDPTSHNLKNIRITSSWTSPKWQSLHFLPITSSYYPSND